MFIIFKSTLIFGSCSLTMLKYLARLTKSVLVSAGGGGGEGVGGRIAPPLYLYHIGVHIVQSICDITSYSLIPRPSLPIERKF